MKKLILITLCISLLNSFGASFSGDTEPLGEAAKFQPSGETKVESGEFDGLQALVVGDSSGGRMAYFISENDSFRQGRTPDVILSIPYFDQGSGSVEVVYDAADLSSNQSGVWKKAGGFNLNNTGTWKVKKIRIDDAQFSGRCNGNDIRLQSDSPFIIHGLHLKSALPIDEKGLLKVGVEQADVPLKKMIKDRKIINWSSNRKVSFELSSTHELKGFLVVNYSAPEPFILHYEIPGFIEETSVQMRATGNWNTYGSLKIGQLDLPPGEYELILRNRDQKSFMHLRTVECTATKPPPFSEELPRLYTDPAESFAQAMIQMREHAARPEVQALRVGADLRLNVKDGKKINDDFPKEADWFLQDNQLHDDWGRGAYDARRDYSIYLEPERNNTLEQQLIATVLKEIPESGLSTSLDQLVQQNLSPDDPKWLELYEQACRLRRQKRLAPLLEETKQIVYATHMNMGTIYLATEHQGCPDGSQLRLIDLTPEATGDPLTDELLFDSENGIVRDPELSFDGKKLLFAWRKTNANLNTIGKLAPATGNYKIYEMDLETREIRPLTDDGTYGADIEPCYLPDGNIMFSSQRVVHEVTCGWGDCSNLFIMDGDGKYARRVGFDQTQSAFPHLLNDGRVVFTRRDYNDRGQSYGHTTMVMNPDGTKQTEYYGNNSAAPTSIQHLRPIPGTRKTMGIAGGYHTTQGGKLLTVDPSKGRQNYDGLTFYNWVPTPLAEVSDENYCRVGEQFAYPYPFDENNLLVSSSPIGAYLTRDNGFLDNRKEQGQMLYNLYYMTLDGRRELLATHPTLSCTQAIPVRPRKCPAARPGMVDYTKETSTCYVQDVYYGTSAEGIEPGSIKKLRVVQLFYKPVTIGAAIWAPPRDQVGPGRKYAGIGNHSVLPTGVGTASWDTKQILGEVDVHEDGSVMFEIPARAPVYFQLIDQHGEVAQTMRSWATLMPNETFSCVGCHEENDSAPLSQSGKSMAMSQAPQKLQPLYDLSDEPFSYPEKIQPIWDKHCVSCHAPGKKAENFDLSGTLVLDYAEETSTGSTRRKFQQSYLTLLDVQWKKYQNGQRMDEGRSNDIVNYWTRMSKMELIPPYYAGSIKSKLMDMLRDEHKRVQLKDKEIETVAAWIDLNVPYVGEYDEMNIWDDAAKEIYRSKVEMRKKQEAIEAENIKAYIAAGQPAGK